MAASGAKPEAADLERSFRKAPLAAVRTKANLTAGSDPKRTFESGLCALNARVPRGDRVFSRQGDRDLLRPVAERFLVLPGAHNSSRRVAVLTPAAAPGRRAGLRRAPGSMQPAWHIPGRPCRAVSR